MLWRMAWRNLWRNRARTATMLTAVALAYALLLVGIAITDDTHARMLEDAARAAGGDVLVHGKEYWATRASDIVIADADAVLGAVREVEGVRAAIPRVLIEGLASTSADTRPVLLYGIDPALEAELDDPADDVVEGTLLGTDGASSRVQPIVLGARLAERLRVAPGDRVVLTATRPDGEVTRALFHLTGIYASGQRQLDDVIGYTTVHAAQRALGMEGMLTQVGVLAEAEVDGEALAARVRAALALPSLEVLSWREAVPEMVGFIEIDAAFGLIIGVVLYVVVLFSIANTFLMAVMERVREFGLLNALGMRGRGVGRLILAETTLLVLLAVGAGLVLALAAHFALETWGMSMALYGVEEMDLAGIDMADMVIRSKIVPLKWFTGTIAITLATLASALYPAWRASRLAPAEAMRFYE